MQNDNAVSGPQQFDRDVQGRRARLQVGSRGVEEPGHQTKFLAYSSERGRMGRDLQAEVRRLGGDPEKSGSAAGSLHRGWLDLKAVLTGHDDHAIVAEAERGEDVATSVFEAALKESLPASAQARVQEFAAKVRHAHDEVISIRDQEAVLK